MLAELYPQTQKIKYCIQMYNELFLEQSMFLILEKIWHICVISNFIVAKLYSLHICTTFITHSSADRHKVYFNTYYYE